MTMDIDLDAVREIVDQMRVEAETLEDAPGEVVAATRACWNLREDAYFGYSAKSMTDDDLQMAIVEDLLLVASWREKGKEVGGDRDHLTRFLDDEGRTRVFAQLESPMVKSLITVSEDGSIEVHPHHMQDAMDFCGFWLEGWDFLTGDTVLSAGPALR